MRTAASATGRKRRSELPQKHFGTISKTRLDELMPLFDASQLLADGKLF
jgi:hypothetical protein